jgi:hypothetical protein
LPTGSEPAQSQAGHSAEFYFALGVALGCALGLAIGYWTAYQHGMNYAAQAVTDYIKQMPPDCQSALNGSSTQLINTIKIDGNGVWQAPRIGETNATIR